MNFYTQSDEATNLMQGFQPPMQVHPCLYPPVTQQWLQEDQHRSDGLFDLVLTFVLPWNTVGREGLPRARLEEKWPRVF